MSWSAAGKPRRTGQSAEQSDDLDGDAIGVGSERFEVCAISGEHGAAGLGESDHERVHR
jgi:hypothetical protein